MKRFLNILFILSVAASLQAQDKGLIEVRAEVDTSVITIGDRITYSIIINRDEHLRTARPGEGLNLGQFEIKGYDFPEAQHQNGRVIERFNFNISVYDTGHYAIPPFPVAYFLDDTTSKYSIIEAPAVPIFVKSVMNSDEAGTLKDIKEPIEIPFDYWFWFLVSAAVIFLIVAAWLLYYFIKKHREKGYLFSPPPPPRPAHEIALEELEKLFASDLLQKKLFKAFFSRLSEIMRIYLEGRYFIAALEKTTAEIMRELHRHEQDKERRNMLEQLLTLSDLVKFAKYLPEDAEINRSKTQAMDFVNQTKLIFETPEETEEKEETEISETKAIEAPVAASEQKGDA